MKPIRTICQLTAFFLLASCAGKHAPVAGYNSLEQCRAAAKSETKIKTRIALGKESQNWIVYSYERIIDSHTENIDTTCKYDPSTKKWNYDLSGSIEINYRYKHGILDIPGDWFTMAMWTGNSHNQVIPINDL